MFSFLPYTALQHYWWMIIALLASLLVFLLFVQGGQTLLYRLGKTEMERKILVNSLGRKWEFTFTTLVTFGGAFFASFPLFYAASFGGAYALWMLILFCFIIQAIAYEFRSKPNNFLGKRTYEIFLFINGLLATLLLGTVLASFFTGSSFFVNEMNQSQWKTPYHGLELIFDFSSYSTCINISLGIAVFFLARMLAILYFFNTIDNDKILERAQKYLLRNTLCFIAFFLFFLINILVKKGFAVHPQTKTVYYEPFKYLHNFLEMPWAACMFPAGLLLALFGIFKTLARNKGWYRKGIWFSGTGTVLLVFSLFIVAGFNHTAFYPSLFDLQSSLTIENASSSLYTLKTMAYVSLFIPFVFAYIWYAWRAINKTKISAEEFKEDTHSY